MRKILSLILISFCSGLTANAQLDKGVWMIGGSGSLYSYHIDRTPPAAGTPGKYTDINFSASIGYFFLDKFSAGLRPAFYSFKGEGTSASTDSYKFTLGPFARYYFLNQDNQFNILTDVSYQIGTSNRWETPKRGKFNILSVMAGAELYLNTTVGIEVLIGYKNQIESLLIPDGLYTNKRGLQTSIGFQFHLEKK